MYAPIGTYIYIYIYISTKVSLYCEYNSTARLNNSVSTIRNKRICYGPVHTKLSP